VIAGLRDPKRGTVLYREGVHEGMSGKSKFILALALVAVIYFLVSGDEEPVEVDVSSDSE
jgi:hypothetical protein